MSLNKIARHGRAVLEATPEAPKRTAKTIVRIYYISQAGEVLCTDSAPMTVQAAESLVNRLAPCAPGYVVRGRATDAVRVEAFPVTIPNPVRLGARLVVFPSMMPAVDGATLPLPLVEAA